MQVLYLNIENICQTTLFMIKICIKVKKIYFENFSDLELV